MEGKEKEGEEGEEGGKKHLLLSKAAGSMA